MINDIRHLILKWSLWIPDCEQRWLHGTPINMESSNIPHDDAVKCQCYKSMISSNATKEKCSDCELCVSQDNKTIESPDMKFYDAHGQEFSENVGDNHNDELHDFQGLNIDDILIQDDPPKEMYLNDDKFDEREILEDIEGEIEWMTYYNDHAYAEDFNIYEHFGIPSDVSDDVAEAMLEAAIPDRG